MSIKKLVPWNWFKNEEENDNTVSIRRSEQGSKQQIAVSDPFAVIQKEINNIFNSFGSNIFSRENIFSSPERLLKPNLDISESKKDYSISIEVPGVDEKDISIELSGDSLIISGEKKQETETKENNYHRVERSYGSFRRILSLPQDADPENIKATFKNGILNIKIDRKSLPSSNVKKISIN
ncbi:heat shock protein Hsp20 [Denitrovibrio acetiphilus DSM 12809]|jgi:HSP20 family protein|uniref:Heat shock protein Hsp20 n=1 Tax=Denitrovibrio acetiphilus (strain DSM 12809 / NBRC 114555 / N2460) TaxID=522772 RepID=D4H8B7_DENA2|nr:Hsp20/alpha crystallin family protein [Denitrovibrio acetiphilus]ADD68266.1 heat shock protein Hsp20 [Denitrovibrio acetiphilus DSM 12809]